jgi:hypothetical protein
VADKKILVDRAIPPNERTVRFDQTSASAGDVLMVDESLGRPGADLLVDTDAELTFRINVYHTLYTRRTNDFFMMTDHMDNVGSGVRMKSDSNALIELEASETLSHQGPIKDIELVTVSGNWDMLIS